MGHKVGDLLLTRVAVRSKNCVREVDCAARMGGDEFAILLNQVANQTDLKSISMKIVKEIEKPFIIENTEINIGSSIGFAVWPDQGDSFEELLHSADQAMYIDKQQHKYEQN